MALIKNNAEVAAKIAVELNGSAPGAGNKETVVTKPLNETNVDSKPNDPVVIGGSIVDLSYSVQEENLQVS